MRATVMYAAGDVRIENVPDPTIVDPTDALVRVTRACICGSDLWPYRLRTAEQGRATMGHEAIGVVEAVGRDVRRVKRGDFVIMPFAFSDGTCEFCHDGLHTACTHGGFFGIGMVGGGAVGLCGVIAAKPPWNASANSPAAPAFTPCSNAWGLATRC